MAILRINLLGRFSACCDGRSLTGFEIHKVRELFCYLLLNRDQPHPREALANLLWEEDQTGRPVRSLRKTLWQLRTALDVPSEASNNSFLLVEPDWIQLNPNNDLWLDVAEFEQAFDSVQGMRPLDLAPQHVQALRSAVDLYRGGLQENWYHDWYLFERERLQHMYLTMLDKLMGYCEAHCEYEAGLALGAQVLRCERARERTHRRLMRLHCMAGDRTAALRQYERCIAALDKELGVKPAERTTILHKQIQSGQLTVPTRVSPALFSAPDTAAATLPELFQSIEQLRIALAEAQRQLDTISQRLSR